MQSIDENKLQTALLDTVFSYAPIGLALVDKNLRYIKVNTNIGQEQSFFNGSHIGKTVPEVIPQFWEEVEPLYKMAFNGKPVINYEFKGMKDGKNPSIWFLSYLPVFLDGEVNFVTVIVNNITSLRTKEKEIERVSRLYDSLGEINQAIISIHQRDKLLNKICKILKERAGFKMSWVGWNDEKINKLIPIAEFGDEDGYLNKINIYTDDRQEVNGYSGRAFKENRNLICNDIFSDDATIPWRNEMTKRGYRSSAAFPITENGKVRGVLSVYSDVVNFFQDKERSLLVEVASDVSFALDNLLIHEDRILLESLANSEKLFSDAIFQSMPGIIYFYDRNGKFLRWNTNMEKISGYSSEEIKKMSPIDFVGHNDRENIQLKILEVFEIGESWTEASLLTKDGRLLPHYFTGKKIKIQNVDCLVGVGIDVTERNLAKEAHQKSEAMYRTLFKYAPDGIVIADKLSNYIDGNDSICKLLGYSQKEFIGLNAKDIVVHNEIANIEIAIQSLEKNFDHQKVWILKRKDGSVFPAEIIATTMPDGSYMGMIRDITERIEAEKALRVLNESLEQKVEERTMQLDSALKRAEEADRLKSAFLATMSHELRTPLNSIIGFTGTVLQGLAGPLTQEQQKQLGMVRSSARHLLELINDVLDLSKIEAGQLIVTSETFNLRELLERVVAIVSPMAEKKKLKIICRISSKIDHWISDRRRVEQIILNLLNNAIKFTDVGEVLLTAEIITSGHHTLSIAVKDTGIGIKEENLGYLFQPFRQIETGLMRQHEGTGLGLVICRRLVELLGGRIEFQSEWTKGSEFKLLLPILERTNFE